MAEAVRSAALSTGLGRLLVFVYGVFALSATGRSVVQIATKLDEAPVPYVLSAIAAAVYCVATWALATDRRRPALVAVLVELVGVVAIGIASTVWSDAFPDQTVWSDFGVGYGYVPLVLPVVGLWWLASRGRSPAVANTGE